MFDEMRQKLEPFNKESADIVKMGIHSNHGYMTGEAVRMAIDCAEQRAMICKYLGDKLNPLETLGLILLMESAGMMEDQT